ncbi:MAG: hypothetical protein B7Y41_03610 [Hydrogenophilales bacterium 28-61-23]|nr:MAG: hypothetical protein B7Y41_03610 [Hydrogenophilales bacterium 28-61-23]
MRLYEFVPVNDHFVNAESLIHRVFATEFCVVDDTGQLLTTAHNRNLLRRARMLVEHADTLDDKSLAEGLHDLAVKAETVRQQDYELALRQDSHELQHGVMENYELPAADSRFLEV